MKRKTQMHKTRYLTRCVVLLAALMMLTAVSATAADDPDAAKAKERELIGLLLSADTPPADKAITCKKLAIYGSAEAVPALAPLLEDERLISWARIALEAIPGPEADKALRDAMATLKGRSLIGVINSIAVRRDAAAVEGLAGRLKDGDAEVASAAAVALGKIGNDAAAKTLRQSLAGAPDAVRSAVAEGCILCAERLLADGKDSDAAAIYDEVRKSKAPQQRILEATRGAILARKAEGIPMLVELLRSEDKRAFRLGLTTARELGGTQVADALATELVQASPQRGALLLMALADSGGTVTSPAVLKAAKSGPKPMRIAAIGVLQRMGDAACVPALLEIAVEDDADLAQAAKAALAEAPGKGVDAEITARLAKAEGKTLPILIEAVGRRRIDATAALLKAVDDPNAEIRTAVLTALGETVGPGNLSVLIERFASPKNPDDAETVRKALRTACVRMPDREACAGQLISAMARSNVSTQCAFLEVLAAMGGPKALQAMGAAAKSGNEELQDASSRLLGEWMTVDAGPVLLDVAQTAKENKYKIRALRGYIRLARQFNMSDRDRVVMCVNALKASTRPDEQKLVLEVVERYPSLDMLRLAVKATQVPALKNDAERISLVIAQKLGGKSIDAQKLLAQMGQEPAKIEIIKAEYGAGGKQKDVTKILQRHVGGLRLIPLPSPKYNAAFGGDPAPGIVKQLKIQYRINGKAGEATFAENAVILLPMPK